MVPLPSASIIYVHLHAERAQRFILRVQGTWPARAHFADEINYAILQTYISVCMYVCIDICTSNVGPDFLQQILVHAPYVSSLLTCRPYVAQGAYLWSSSTVQDDPYARRYPRQMIDKSRNVAFAPNNHLPLLLRVPEEKRPILGISVVVVAELFLMPRRPLNPKP